MTFRKMGRITQTGWDALKDTRGTPLSRVRGCRDIAPSFEGEELNPEQGQNITNRKMIVQKYLA